MRRFGGVVVLWTLAGCGGSTPSAAPSAGQPPSLAQTAPAPASRDTPVEVTADGRKSIDGIPYDVFFDDPLAVASDNQTVAAAPGVSIETPAETPQPTPSAGKTASGTDSPETDWPSLISMDTLQEETKSIRNHLTASLQSVGSYNGSYKEIRVDGATLAAVAGIVQRHPETVTWKAHAPHVRDLGKEIFEASKALGAEAFDRTQLAYEKAVAVLNGNLPPDLGEATPTRPFEEVANRNGLMRRMQKSYEWLSSNINNETSFTTEQETILHESQLLAAFATVVAEPGYGSADEQEYRDYARQMIDASLGTVDSAKSQDYRKFSESLAAVNKACNACHSDYRFAE